MTRLRAFVFLALAMTALLVASSPFALAQADGEDSATTVQEPAGLEPAVVVDESSSPPSSDAWTFRYLVPTFIALTVLAVLAVTVGYFLRIRARYVVKQ